MPPELLDGESTLHGKEADCWSLGVLFYWLLCGCDPFPLGLERRTVRRLEKKTYVLPQRRVCSPPRPHYRVFRYQWPGRGYQELSADAQKFLQSILVRLPSCACESRVITLHVITLLVSQRPKPTERLTCDAMIRHPYVVPSHICQRALILFPRVWVGAKAAGCLRRMLRTKSLLVPWWTCGERWGEPCALSELPHA